jgi:hypothetical protein
VGLVTPRLAQMLIESLTRQQEMKTMGNTEKGKHANTPNSPELSLL